MPTDAPRRRAEPTRKGDEEGCSIEFFDVMGDTVGVATLPALPCACRRQPIAPLRGR